MSAEGLIPITKTKIPTIVGFDVRSNTYTIGDAARLSSLMGRGQNTVFNFKPAFGRGDAEFSKDKDYWFNYPLEDRTALGRTPIGNSLPLRRRPSSF
jgi:molecular chaperone DnaK (HSP70)